MTTVNVLHRPQSPSGGSPRTMRAELIATLAAYTDDHTTTVLGAEDFDPDATGLVTLRLRPNSELVQTDTYYRVRIARSEVTYYCVVPDAGPVQLVNILVDPTTLNPAAPPLAPLFQLRSEKAQANGYPSLDGNGRVPTAQLPESAGGETPDATALVKGILRLTNHLAGTADAPELSDALLSLINAAYVKPGAGIPSTDLTVAVQAALSAAGTAVQPATLTATANARGLQARSKLGPFVATFGPCGNGGNPWTVCPNSFRSTPVAAAVGDVVDWLPSFILGAVTASADAEFDLATINNTNTAAPVILRCLSSDDVAPLANGEGGMYCWQNNARRVPAVLDWQVTNTDLVGGTITFALLYKAAGSGLSVGHGAVYGSRITVRNWGKVPS